MEEQDAGSFIMQRGWHDTQVFYAMIQFFRGFGDAYFDGMFNFTMKNDPVLGEGSADITILRRAVLHNA